jgi:hypothetical protein
MSEVTEQQLEDALFTHQVQASSAACTLAWALSRSNGGSGGRSVMGTRLAFL